MCGLRGLKLKQVDARVVCLSRRVADVSYMRRNLRQSKPSSFLISHAWTPLVTVAYMRVLGAQVAAHGAFGSGSLYAVVPEGR
jgi:hypothetical protein